VRHVSQACSRARATGLTGTSKPENAAGHSGAAGRVPWRQTGRLGLSDLCGCRLPDLATVRRNVRHVSQACSRARATGLTGGPRPPNAAGHTGAAGRAPWRETRETVTRGVSSPSCVVTVWRLCGVCVGKVCVGRSGLAGAGCRVHSVCEAVRRLRGGGASWVCCFWVEKGWFGFSVRVGGWCWFGC
jgi:hypothetical protein